MRHICLRRVRGNVNNKVSKYNSEYFAIFDRNEANERNVADLAPKTRQVMGQLRADPKIASLEKEAMAFHEARVKKLREAGEYEPWVAELRDAGRTPIDQLDSVLFTHHLPKEWQAKVKEMQAAGVPNKEIAKFISGSKTARKTEGRAAMAAAANAEVGVTTHGDDTLENAAKRHSAQLARAKAGANKR